MLVTPEIGSTIFDNYNSVNVNIHAKNKSNYVHGIIDYNIRTKEIVKGWFYKVLNENILMFAPELEGTFLAMNKRMFGDDLYYNNIKGLYSIRKTESDIIGEINLLKGSGGFPYTIERKYDAESSMKLFKNVEEIPKIFSDKYKNLIKYTFGIEYETCSGYIPQDLCYSHGLIPLRDGSISGVEYATVVMDKELGFERIIKQMELLNTYTTFDRNCSLHLHFGNVPVREENILSLYMLSVFVQEELAPYLPAYSFDTRNYKASGKDYCKRLPKNISSFEDLYIFVGDMQARYAGSLDQPHPRDPKKEAKWQVKSRYHWLNLVNMCFYNRPKTVEFRMLRPTHNVNKLIFWIYFFNAMLLYSEKLSGRILGMKSPLIYMRRNFKGIKDMLLKVYPEELCNKMFKMLDDLRYIVKCQTSAQDLIGELTDFEDSVIRTNLLTND